MNIKTLNLTNFASGEVLEISKQQEKAITISQFKFFSTKTEEEEKEYTKSFFENEIAKAKKQAFEEGYSKAKAEFDNYLKNDDIKLKEQVSSMLARFLDNLNKFKQEQKDYKINITNLAHQFTKKVCASKIAENSEQIFINALEKISGIIEKEPSIIIKASEDLILKLQSSIEDFFSKNLPNIIPKFEKIQNANASEICIEWEKSGITINLNERLNAIDEIFAEYIKTL